ncbi:MAG: hypothetical protein SOR54_09820 [Clostridioides difficile]|nr:hypothetical protein [Clostridioides difficile]
MNIPKTIKVGGISYKIIECDCPSEEDCAVEGQIFYQKQEIRIKNNVGKEYKEKVFLHEVIHALFEHACIEQDEIIIERLSSVLHEFIKDNSIIFDLNRKSVINVDVKPVFNIKEDFKINETLDGVKCSLKEALKEGIEC